MKPLDIDRLNLHSPYHVVYKESKYVFKTDYDIVYAIQFEFDGVYIGNPAYWFVLTNQDFKSSPNDVKLKDTVISIIEEFFRKNSNILLYMCANTNDQQAMRNRLLLRWFNSYKLHDSFSVHTARLQDEDIDNYVALIVQRNNPLYHEIVTYFNEVIGQFKENKP